jgi:hypothetical protein
MNPNTTPEILLEIKVRVLDPLGIEFKNLVAEKESHDYSAHHFELDQSTVIFRSAKTTPKKVGQFVTLWKRNQEGETQPYDLSDTVDLILITTFVEHQMGHFIFPKSVLFQQGILSGKLQQGKRGFRVYPPWDFPNSTQAQKSQKWQNNYFLEITDKKDIDWVLAKRLYFKR